MTVLVPVMRDKRVSREKTIDYMRLGEALTRPFATRTVVMAYSLPTHPHRLVKEDLETYDGVPMRLLILDVDDLVAHKTNTKSTPEWRSGERTKIEALIVDHPDAFVYLTPRGWRAVYRLAEPFVINDPADEERWRASYLAAVDDLHAKYGIDADPSGSRWSQCFDLPRATRDGGIPERPETIGDAHDVGVWELRIVEPAPVRKRGEVTADVEDSVLGREFIRRGMAGKVKRGKLLVVCPWAGEHTTGTDLDESTIVMPPTTERRRGWFHCSHAHCIGRDARIFAKLGLVEESTRLVQLRADLESGDDSQRVPLEQVEELMTTVMKMVAGPGCLLVISVTLGAGKTRSVVKAATASERPWVIAVPRHDLGGEVAGRFGALGVRTNRRRGVLRVVGADDKPACKQHVRAAALQAVGGSVPATLCATCPHERGCPARKREKPQRVTIVPHQLAGSEMDREREDGVPLLVFDETPALLEELPLVGADLAEAVRQLDGDLLDPQFAIDLRPFISALAKAGDDPAHDLLVACAGDTDAEAIVQGTHFFGTVPRFRVDPNALPHEKNALAPARWAEFLETFRIFRAILAAQEVRRIAWRSDGLAVHANTPEALLLQKGGAVIVDATPPLAMLNALVAGTGVDVWPLIMSVADGAPIERKVLYSSGASRSKLAPGRTVEWSAVQPLLARALVPLRDITGRILLVTFKAIADGLRAGELADLLGDRVDVAHYGATRGSDVWRDHAGLATLGDPIPNVDTA